MNICLFSENEICSPLSLKDERAKHIIKVLHKNVGDTFKAGIIIGKEGNAIITNIDSEKIDFKFTPEKDGLKPNPLVMIIGFPRPIQLKRLLRDVAALGVKEVHLCGTELGEKSYMESNLSTHDAAYKLLIDGTVQAGTTSVPKLFIHKTLNDCLAYISPKTKFRSLKINLFALDNINPKCSLKEALCKKNETNENENSYLGGHERLFVAAIGSERGWTDNERKLLEDAGFTRCSMGKRIMRTETAATVSASIILAEIGSLC